MALTYSSTVADRIALSLYGRQYAQLQVYEKQIVDAGWAAGPVGGAAGDALTRINQYAQWFAQAGATASPDAWLHWWIQESCAIAAPAAREDKYKLFIDQRERALDAAMTSFMLDDTTLATVYGQAITVQGLRWYVLNSTARRKPRLFIPISDIDAQTVWCLSWLWNRCGWNFRRRQCTMTIPITGIPTWDLPAGESFKSVASVRWYYNDVTGVERDLAHLNARELAVARVKYQNLTGRPRYFRIEPRVSGILWNFTPSPDKQYTAVGEVFVDGPGTPANATDAAPFAKFPAPFQLVLRDAVLARTLMKHSQKDGEEMWAKVQDDVAVFLTGTDDIGNIDGNRQPGDVYNDALEQTGDNWQIGGQL